MRAADRTLVLDAGAIAAEGTHDTLLKTSPLDRQLAGQFTHETDRPAA